MPYQSVTNARIPQYIVTAKVVEKISKTCMLVIANTYKTKIAKRIFSVIFLSRTKTYTQRSVNNPTVIKLFGIETTPKNML